MPTFTVGLFLQQRNNNDATVTSITVITIKAKDILTALLISNVYKLEK